ncbi:MAG: 4Fe-4S dicluster domain-containing protein [Deltaproteobacteria bacterium]|nr:4Fe-4S dicluster domain-containing protein [Deltaproteobacteria bacterium]
MLIDKETCKGCGNCVPYCPMEAIIFHRKDRKKEIKPYAEIDPDECVECAVCLRADVCPTDSIREEKLEWPRILRKAFSDPLHIHKGTDVPGRGTEEMKTNDVTGRFRDGYIGVGLELGRPGTGTRFREVEKVIQRFVGMDIELEPLNPVTQLIANKQTGELCEGVLDEKVLSAIVEFTVPIERAQEVFSAVKEVAGEIDTVFSLDLICKVSHQGEIPIMREIDKAGLVRSLNGKVNVGLGRPLFQA